MGGFPSPAALGPGRFGLKRAVSLVLISLVFLAPLGGCASQPASANFLQSSTAPAAPTDYVIGPLDQLSIRVFQVADLSLDKVQVDASGQIVLPLIGNVQASGKTTQQLSREITHALSERYLQSPQVSVSVVDSASLKVTVEGDVKTPGVFPMRGRTTLMEAIAMAGGPSDTADLRHIAVIRTVDGVRKAAICNYQAIRSGALSDPVIEGNDIVVVDGSEAKKTWKNLLTALPLFTLFAYAL